MKFSEWLLTDERSRVVMAAFVGVHPTTFSRWASGRNVPSKRYVKKIRILTNDKVTLADFYPDTVEARE
jgi:DNA-binding transcriptional regulator YdaS (Cro superfamily)